MKYFLLAVLLVGPVMLAESAVPELNGVVNDYAEVLTPEEEATLSDLLLGVEEKSTNQVVVLTVESLEGESVEGFAMAVVEAWQLGQADKDNGVLLLVATGDRQIRIEVGYGLEAVLTDGMAGQIIRNDIGPALKQGKYYDGISAGVAQIHRAIAGEFTATNQDVSWASLPVLLIIFVAFILCVFVGPELSVVGGGIGAVAGFLAFWSAYPLSFMVMLWIILGGVLGLVVSFLGRAFLMGLAEGASSGGYSSSKSSGGGRSGGGYSGGGGSFGGGGASGGY